MSKVVLITGGKRYDGWTSMSLTRSLEQLATTFSLALTERWAGTTTTRPLLAGDACRVELDDEQVADGYIFDAEASYDATQHSVSCEGRDKLGDVVDCSAIAKPGQWTKRTLAQIASDLLAPFGLSVRDDARATTPFAAFKLNEGECVFEALDRAARMRGVLLTSDGGGTLVLARAGSTRVSTTLERGVNILSASRVESWKDRHDRIIVKSQTSGTDTYNGKQAAQAKAEVTDDTITRYRPLVMLAEMQAPPAELRDRAAWERNVRYGRGLRVTCDVQGWAHRDGLWSPGSLVHLADDWLGVNEELLIASVTSTLDEQGTRSQLSLTRPEAFDILQTPKRRKKAATAMY